jgi:hypothetical protein
MNNAEFVFRLNPEIKIIIRIDEYDEEVPYCFYDASFYLWYKEEMIKLCYFSLQSYIDKLIEFLQRSLQNQKQLPCYLAKNIGYVWNEYVNVSNHQKLSYADKKYEFLENYYIWYSSYTTWIYNDEQGDIILEVTPSYPNTYSEKFSYKGFLAWMENYKSFLRVVIPQQVAELWLMQATQILAAIDENTQRLHAQGKL